MTDSNTTTTTTVLASHRRARRRGRGMLGAIVAAVVVAAVAAVPAGADHGEPWGANHGVAAADGQAWPGSLAWWAGTCDLAGASTADGGVGGAPAEVAHCIDHGAPYEPASADASPPLDTTWEPGSEPSWRLDPVAQAGAHPDASASMWFQRSPDPSEAGTAPITAVGDGDTRTIVVKLPPGVVGDPNAVATCSSAQVRSQPPLCPPASQVGVATVTTSHPQGAPQSVFPVWNVEPRDGKTAEFLISASPVGEAQSNVPIVAKARTAGDFGIDTMAIDIPGGLPLLGQTITLWGVPWAAEHDRFRPPAGYEGHRNDANQGRGGMPETGLDGSSASQMPQSWDPSWGEIRPFLSNPTECAPDVPVTVLELTSWQDPGLVKSYDAPADALVDGCEKPDFDVGFELEASTSVADAPSGLEVDLSIPQNDELPFEAPKVGAPQAEVDQYVADATAHWQHPDGRGLAVSQLDKAVVTLPAGVSVNPAGAAGLAGCADGQIGLRANGNPPLFNNEDPFDGQGAECPAGSVIGTAEVFTPLLPGADLEGKAANLTGQVVLGEPRSTDPTSGEMLRMFVVVRNAKRGLLAKIHGSAIADPTTGQITATFDRNPRVPFEHMSLKFKGGDRGLLATPQTCGSHGWASTFSPWTAAHGAGGQPVSPAGAFAIDARCGLGFSPTLTAGVDDRSAGGSGTFSLRFARQDGEQWFRALTAKLPTGLLASLRGVPLCSGAQANAGACPAGSRIGTVDAGAGSGSPFFLERKGAAYLTEGYKGAPYGMAVVVPVEAGPFRGAMALDDVVVRQALHVDRTTAQVTAVSDPFPTIWHGIPLRVRQATVKVDRGGFIRNPTDCAPKQIATTITSARGAVATPAARFRATGCAAVPFEPRMALRLVGRRQVTTGKHPAVRALVRQQGIGEAGIEHAEVRLPKSLALDPANAQALCEFEDGTKPDIENHCPAGSIVGRARAVTPLLNRPLRGDVYFVKNVRIDPDTGNEIRTLPMIVVALRGEIAINLTGESSTTRSGKLVNTFADVPDAPISRFNLNIKGGRNGILAVTRSGRSRFNLCRMGRQVAEADLDGHNGKRHDINVAMRKPCGKRRASAAKICRKRTDNKRALRRCVRNVKKVRAKRAAAKRKANRRATRRGGR